MKAFAAKLYSRVCIAALFFLAAAASFNGFFVKWQFADSVTLGEYWQVNSFESIVSGTADRPFVYRQLLPMISNWVGARIPDRIRNSLLVNPVSGKPTSLSLSIDSPLARDRTWFVRYLIVYVIAFLSTWVAVFALFKLGTTLGFPMSAAALGAVGFILLVPFFLTQGGYFYDYPELAFFAVAAWMAVKYDWWWLLPVAALASLNKETFLVFALTLYPFFRIRNSRFMAIIGTAGIVSVSALVDGLIWLHYRNNPTIQPSISYCLRAHLEYLRTYFSSPFREKTYGLPENQIVIFLLLAVVVWTAWRGWKLLPRAAQRHAQIAIAINLPLYLLFCTPGELRNFSLLYVSLFLLMTANLAEVIGADFCEKLLGPA